MYFFCQKEVEFLNKKITINQIHDKIDNMAVQLQTLITSLVDRNTKKGR